MWPVDATSRVASSFIRLFKREFTKVDSSVTELSGRSSTVMRSIAKNVFRKHHKDSEPQSVSPAARHNVQRCSRFRKTAKRGNVNEWAARNSYLAIDVRAAPIALRHSTSRKSTTIEQFGQPIGAKADDWTHQSGHALERTDMT